MSNTNFTHHELAQSANSQRTPTGQPAISSKKNGLRTVDHQFHSHFALHSLRAWSIHAPTPAASSGWERGRVAHGPRPIGRDPRANGMQSRRASAGLRKDNK